MQAILVYFITLKLYSQGWVSWVWAAVLVTSVPYALSLLTFAILQKMSFFEAAAARGGAVVLVMQLGAALGLFYWLERKERSFAEWGVAGVIGCIGLYVGVPQVVGLLI